MNNQIEILRNELEKLILEKENMIDSEVLLLSQELDKLLISYVKSET